MSESLTRCFKPDLNCLRRKHDPYEVVRDANEERDLEPGPSNYNQKSMTIGEDLKKHKYRVAQVGFKERMKMPIMG